MHSIFLSTFIVMKKLNLEETIRILEVVFPSVLQDIEVKKKSIFFSSLSFFLSPCRNDIDVVHHVEDLKLEAPVEKNT